MKVRELIKQLQSMDQDLDVTLYTGWEGPQHLELSDITIETGDFVGQTSGRGKHAKHVLLSS